MARAWDARGTRVGRAWDARGKRVSSQPRATDCGVFESRLPFSLHQEQTVNNEPVNPSAKGWGFALAIIILAIVANVTAFSIHKATYLKPDRHASAEK